MATKDKIEIFNELKKYECNKTIDFFQKINDSERNNQIRRMAFEHLQKIGAFLRLRKNYTTERGPFDVTPKDLVDRIEMIPFKITNAMMFLFHIAIKTQV
ncbi:hypothetical protein WOB69_08305 [Vibrio parahaemolyticus]|nr:hypothetical protein [Vibrio alginolyticus]MBE4539375.1 hypothetical protein [Vibrio parahaemolyticus]